MAENKFFSSPSVDIIESSTKIVGDIYSKADFRIDGIVEGNITTTGKVVIGKSGKINGKINSSNADISGSIKLQGKELVGISHNELKRVRGSEVSFIFQEPMTSLNPLHTIEKQLREAVELHSAAHFSSITEYIVELLTRVGIDSPRQRLDAYPHQLSGGQRQRVMIAMAIANNPKILIADEPTTALDVTIEAQILDLLVELKKNTEMGILFITHDLGLVKRLANRVCVMKNGKIVEEGKFDELKLV